MAEAAIQQVKIIFKTHLDLGFTDMAEKVVQRYFEEFLPQAIKTARYMQSCQGPEQYIWTAGSWIILEALEHGPEELKTELDQAIRDGLITWHGLPLTFHSEMMDASLFTYALTLSQQLDVRFEKKTIAAKMTDVPGHTRAIVPLLHEAGLELLHIGINPASCPANLPGAFVWQHPSGSELMVVYQRDYGEDLQIPGTGILYKVMLTGDNLGPHTPEQLQDIWKETQAAYPEAQIMAATLNDMATDLATAKESLPIAKEEIGDSWIHGIGTDPMKVAAFRSLQRLRQYWIDNERITEENIKAFEQFNRKLILVPEHTWGLDVKTHLKDSKNFVRRAFNSARKRDNFQKMEVSWKEQRDYMKQALAALEGTDLEDETRQTLASLKPYQPSVDGFDKVKSTKQTFITDHFRFAFDARSGAIQKFVDERRNHEWATKRNRLGLVTYHAYGDQDYRRFMDQYLQDRPDWAIKDFSKPGLGRANNNSQSFEFKLRSMHQRNTDESLCIVNSLSTSQEATNKFGCPKNLFMMWTFMKDRPIVHLEVSWFNKSASRIPEALFLGFAPRIRKPKYWMMDKMDDMTGVMDVIYRGNRRLHAIGKEVRYRDGKGSLGIETLDAPLVAPGAPSMLDFHQKQPIMKNGIFFNLYNNTWGTNFPQWYDEDAKFRFTMNFGE